MVFKGFKLVSLNVTNKDFPITFYSLTFKDHNSGGMIVLKAGNMAQNLLQMFDNDEKKKKRSDDGC